MKNFARSLQKQIELDLKKKIVILSGPRQAGKTTLAQTLSSSIEYLNYDRFEDRKKILSESWDRNKELLILDEIHKMKNWKRWLKGIYDTEKKSHIIVTGSARLETFKKVGDSLAGRYFAFQLMPLDLKELKQGGYGTTKENFASLWKLSGFPEPFFSESETEYKRWRKTHVDVIIRQDIPELESSKRISDIATLFELMKERVGSPVSHNSLREDLQTDDKSVRRWLQWLENSYALFRITPYSKSVKNTLKKLPKYYFYDFPRVSDSGARLENLVAFSLYKEILYRNDCEGENYSLHYLQNRTHHEVDFLICNDRKPMMMIEVKSSDSEPSKNFQCFVNDLKKQNPLLKQIQLVKDLARPFSTKSGIEVENLATWLEKMNF
jgi:predicted AAA+ superfamily ATPase